MGLRAQQQPGDLLQLPAAGCRCCLPSRWDGCEMNACRGGIQWSCVSISSLIYTINKLNYMLHRGS